MTKQVQLVELVTEALQSNIKAAAKERKARRKGGKSAKNESSNDNDAPQAKTSGRRRSPSKQRETVSEPSQEQQDALTPASVSELPQKAVNKKPKSGKHEPAFGAGVHIPAFLLREPRPKKAS